VEAPLVLTALFWAYEAGRQMATTSIDKTRVSLFAQALVILTMISLLAGPRILPDPQWDKALNNCFLNNQ